MRRDIGKKQTSPDGRLNLRSNAFWKYPRHLPVYYLFVESIFHVTIACASAYPASGRRIDYASVQ